MDINLLYLLIALGVTFLLGLMLWRMQSKQQRIVQNKVDGLWEKLNIIQNDISALCAGALGADERVSANTKRIRILLDRLDELEEGGAQGHIQAFQEATKLAQSGASVEEIIEKCNLTIDEADLLIRLYTSSLES